MTLRIEMMNQLRQLTNRTGWLVIAWALLACVPLIQAVETEPTDDAARKERLAFMKQQAAEYTVTLDSTSRTRLALHDEPLLRFSNAVSGVPDGIVVMWKEGARPAIVAQVFQVKNGAWIHECQSLASAGLKMERDGETFWKPEKGAQAFRPLPDAPRAAATAPKRLVQMKSIAAKFSATDDFKISPADKEVTRNELRPLTTPVYRYQDAKAGIEDGAVFAFVHGTDPELFLVLELRTNDKGQAGAGGSWYYSLTPMTCWGVNASLSGTEIWNVPDRFGKGTITDPYFVWVYRPK